MRKRDSVSARHVRHPDRAEVRRDSRGAEAVVKNGLGAHEVIKNPGALRRIEVLSFNEVEFGEGCKLRGHPSESGTTSFETDPDVGPVVNGNFAGPIKGFAACELLTVPRRRDEAGFGRLNLRPQVIHGLNLFLRSHAVNGFHYG